MGSNGSVEDDLEVRSNIVYFFVEGFGEDVFVVGYFGYVGGEVFDYGKISFVDVLIYGDFGGLDNGFGFVLVLVENVGDFVNVFVSESFFVVNGDDYFGVGVVVGDNVDKFGEMLVILFFDMYSVLVDIFVECVESCNVLDDVVVVFVDVEFDFGVGVGVIEIELGMVDIVFLEVFEEFISVDMDVMEESSDDFGGFGGFVLDIGEDRGDFVC